MLKSGMIIGDRYEILGRIGSGGMSMVYKGRDQKLNRNVAVKVLKSEYREDKNFVRKFREEAQAAACLAHPNIVNVYDVGEEQGVHYIVMELVEGITLKNYIERKGKLTIKEATSIAIQVSMGLEVAHNNEIVHRDIKPQNIMISKDGKVKVMDFGIAKAATSETIASNAMGSVHYTSPEQARGGYSDAKSDIYSLGIVMYEMVTGRVPFDGETTVAVAVKHLQEEMTSPKVYCPELPISLEKIIYKCTEKIATRRYANMAELIADLKQSLQTPEVDFVKQVDVDEAAKTVTITKSDLNRIKRETGRIQLPKEDDEDDFFNDEDDDDYDDDDEYDYDYDEDDDDDEYDDDEYDDDDDEMDPCMEKIMTIGGIAAAVIILIIIIMLAGKILGFGLFTGGDKDKKEEQNQEEVIEDTVEMIDVTGMTWEEAKTALNKLGLGITSGGSEESDEFEEGQIMKQSVEEGQVVEKNTTIEVVTAVKAVKLIKVPDVEGETKEDAGYRLEQEGFVVDYAESFHDTVKKGKVIKTSPTAGSEVAEGSTIVISVSKGADVKYTKVPNLVGKSRADAEAAIKAANLSVGSVTEQFSNDVESGVVISQAQSADKEVEENVTIDFVVSKGTETVVIPDLWGNPKERAVEKLTALGLSVEVYEAYSSEATGRVFEVSPAAGTKVAPGSTVKITLSKGPKPAEKVTVPTVIGKTEAEAKSAIEAAGLKVGSVTQEYSNSIAAGYVSSQSANGEVEKGATVNIVVSKGAETSSTENTDTNTQAQ